MSNVLRDGTKPSPALYLRTHLFESSQNQKLAGSSLFQKNLICIFLYDILQVKRLQIGVHCWFFWALQDTHLLQRTGNLGQCHIDQLNIKIKSSLGFQFVFLLWTYSWNKKKANSKSIIIRVCKLLDHDKVMFTEEQTATSVSYFWWKWNEAMTPGIVSLFMPSF